MKKLLVSCAAISLALSACGGGGGSSDPEPLKIYTPPAVEVATKAAREAHNAKLAQAEAEALDWLSANAEKDGVVSLPSGLQYKVISSGNGGGVSPGAGQTVKVHYYGSLPDGQLFNNSFERGRPAELEVDQMVDGWKEALSLMKPGDEWIIYMPPSLGYGKAGDGPSVPPNSALVFRIVLFGTV